MEITFNKNMIFFTTAAAASFPTTEAMRSNAHLRGCAHSTLMKQTPLSPLLTPETIEAIFDRAYTSRSLWVSLTYSCSPCNPHIGHIPGPSAIQPDVTNVPPSSRGCRRRRRPGTAGTRSAARPRRDGRLLCTGA